MTKEILSALALALTFIAFVPYIRTIMRGAVRPHLFSWVIWAGGTFAVFLAQLSDGAGVGAWPIGISSGLTGIVALLAWRHKADTSITLSDWLFLGMGLGGIVLWYVTANPLYAVILLTIVDLTGFGPSIRKGWRLPHEEDPLFFTLGAVRNGVVIAALENYSWTTALFPAAVGIACLGFVAFILIRRQQVASRTF